MIVQASSTVTGTVLVSAWAAQSLRGAGVIVTNPRSTSAPFVVRRAAASIATAPSAAAYPALNGNVPDPAERTMLRPPVMRVMSRPYVNRVMMRPPSE